LKKKEKIGKLKKNEKKKDKGKSWKKNIYKKIDYYYNIHSAFKYGQE